LVPKSLKDDQVLGGTDVFAGKSVPNNMGGTMSVGRVKQF